MIIELIDKSNIMKVQVGKIYKVKQGHGIKCGSFDGGASKYVKIAYIDSDGYLEYDILDNSKRKIGSCSTCFDAKDLIPAKPTLETLQEGDMVDCSNGETKKVLGVCGQVFFLSMVDDHDVFDAGWTVKEMKGEGFKPMFQDEDSELDEEVRKSIKLLESRGYKVEK